MALNFNADPWYDDYDKTKQFYRILFKPGRAVQARELTQIQSILQNQISSFGDHIFAEGSIVSGGQHHLDDSAFYLKCQSVYNDGIVSSTVDFTDIEGKFIVESSTGKLGYVKKFTDATSTDPVTLHVTIVEGQLTPFNDNSEFFVIDSKQSTTIVNKFTSETSAASGTSLLFHVSEGVFYGQGTFLYCPESTIVLGKYSKVASAVVGLNIEETVVDEIDDPSLLDPALGASNYLAPGADRYKIGLVLSSKQYTDTAVANENFIELIRIKDGNLMSDKRVPVYSDIMDTIARRTYDTNGNFLVKSFLPKIQNDTQNDDKLILQVSQGKGFVQGYEIETISPTTLNLNKARNTESVSSYEINTYYGNFTYVNTLAGSLPAFDSTPDVVEQNRFSTGTPVEIHSVTTDQSSATKIGTAYVYAMDYVSETGTESIYAMFLDKITLTNSTFASAKSFVITNNGDYNDIAFSAIIDGSAIDKAGNAQIYDSNYSQLLFNVPQQYIKSLTNVGYHYKRYFDGTVSSNTVAIQCKTTDSFVDSSTPTAIRQNYMIVDVTTGQFIPVEDITVTLQGSGSNNFQATIDFNTNAYNGHYVDIIATVRTIDDAKRVKNLVSNYYVSANNEYTISDTTTHSLLKSDVYSLTAVYEFDTSYTYKGNWSSVVTYATGDVVMHDNVARVSTISNNLNTDPTTSANWTKLDDASSYYSFDSGQTDIYYDHGTIRRNSKPQTPVKVIPVFSYFTHTGTGFISSESYPVDYSNIPFYSSKTTGKSYSLRDTIDFRPRRIDGSTSLDFDQTQTPQPFTTVTADIEYYLRRIDKTILTRSGEFKVLEGIPSHINPKAPANQADAITLYVLSYKPYTDTIADIDVTVLPYRRYTMYDIGQLDDRLTRVEYYTSLNMVEQQTSAQTLLDSNGNTLFKNGFLVDSFKGHNVGDVENTEYRCSVDYTAGLCRPTYLTDSVKLGYNKSASNTTISGFTESSLITVPYSEGVFVNQPIATNYMSVNPFNVVSFVGRIKLTPESDTWFDTKSVPNVVTNIDGQNDNYAGFTSVETQWNAWQTLWSGENIVDSTTTTVMTSSTTGYKVTRSTVDITQQQVRTGKETLKAPPGVTLSTSTSVVNESVIPYARSHDIGFKVEGMSPNTQLYLYINGLNMTQYLIPTTQSSTGLSSVFTDVNGTATGIIRFPNSNDIKFLAGKQNITICDNPFDYTLSTSYAQATFFSQGLLETLQTNVISTKGDYLITRTINDKRVNVITETRETANVSFVIDTTPAASYSLTSDKSVVKEGETITFVFTAQNSPAGRSFNANVYGTISSSDVGSNAYVNLGRVITTTGTQAVNRYTLSIPVNNNIISNYQNKYITFQVDVPAVAGNTKLGGPLTLYSNVTIESAKVPSYTATAPQYVIPGNTASIVFSGTDIKANTTVSYNVVTTANTSEYSGSANSGSFVINTPSDSETLSFNIANNYTSKGNTDYLNVNFSWVTNNVTSTKTTTTKITPIKRYSLSSNASTVMESQSFLITLNTVNIPNGNTVAYTITGVTSAEISGGSLTGNFTVGANGKSYLVVNTGNITSDKTFSIALNNVTPTVSTSVAIKQEIPVTPVSVSYPTSVLVNEKFNWSISNGPPSGNWYATNNQGTRMPASGTLSLSSTGTASYTGYTLTTPGNVQWTFYFSDGQIVNKSCLVTAPVLVPAYTLTGPSQVNEGDTIVFTLTSVNQSTPTSMQWTISNPKGAWLTKTGTNTGTVNLSGQPDYVAYVENYQDLVIAYYDGKNGTQIFAEVYPGKYWQTAADQYNDWLNNGSWRKNATDEVSFGKWHWETFGKNENRQLPVVSVVSGTTDVSDSAPAIITLKAEAEHTVTGDRTISLTIAGQTKSVLIKDTALSLYPAVSPVTKKLVTRGDFVDSSLTLTQALNQYTYYTDGKTQDQIKANADKICITLSQKAKRDQYGDLVASYYRDPAKLNRNPELSGFIFWVKAMFDWQKNSTITSPAVYPVSSGYIGWTMGINDYGVWVNPGTNCLPNQTQTIYRNITLPYTGSYSVTIGGDDFIHVYLDNAEIANWTSGNWSSEIYKSTFNFSATAGQHVLRFETKNGGGWSGENDWSQNPAAWSVAIKNSNGSVIWDTRTYAAAETVPILGSGMTEAQAISNLNNLFLKSSEFAAGPRPLFLACTTDPLAQTFFVPEAVYPNGVFLTGVSLFFRTVDSTLPVFVEIRPTENGYPSSSQIVPLTTTWKKPYEVNISDNASKETKFSFTDPVYLQPGEYSIIVGSNSNKYQIYYATLGQTQIGTNNIVSSQPNVGSMFKSQNASTWTPDQTSDISFKLYKANFNTGHVYESVFDSLTPSQSFDFHVVQISSKELDFNNKTDIQYKLLTQYDGVVDPSYTNILANKNVNLRTTKNVTSAGDSKLKIDLSTTDTNISPVIDLERLSMVMVKNIINDKSDVIIPETTNVGGNSLAKYVTRYVTLADGFDATGLRVLFDINRQVGSSVEVYCKLKASDDSADFDDKYWQQIPLVAKPTVYSTNDEDFLTDEYDLQNISYVSGGVTYNNFKTFAIKVVMYSSNPAIVPQIKNFRAIATS